MKLFRAGFLALCVVALSPGKSFSDIFEYSDADGRVSYYKYTNRKGSVVFTDDINAIPQEIRKTQKIIKKSVPGTQTKKVVEKPAIAPPPPPEPPAVQTETPKPAEPPKPEPSTDFSTYVAVFVGVVVLLALAAVVRRMVVAMKAPPGSQAALARDHGGARSDGPDAGRKAGADRLRIDSRSSGEKASPTDGQQEVLNRYLQARDFTSAARFCESLGSLEKAATYYREAGNVEKAGEIFLALKDYRRAAEVYESSGDDLKAAELYEAAFKREAPDGRSSPGSDSALRSGGLYEKAGDADRALEIFLKARLFGEAAALYEKKQDFTHAAESYLKSGNAERAADCYERGGDPARANATLSAFFYEKGLVKEAAAFTEKAGDLMRAAEMFQEAGDYSRAGELFCRAGFFDEAAENYVLANDQAGAAVAFEKAGKYLEAAKACEAIGAEPARVAELFEKGEDFHAAGWRYIKAGALDRALNALQKVDPATENGKNASLLIAKLFLKKGKVQLALEKFSKIVGDQPVGKSNLEPYYFLALCHESSGDAGKAKAIFEKILVEDYNFRDVRHRVEKSGGAHP